jgi:hypothetical protein
MTKMGITKYIREVRLENYHFYDKSEDGIVVK